MLKLAISKWGDKSQQTITSKEVLTNTIKLNRNFWTQ